MTTRLMDFATFSPSLYVDRKGQSVLSECPCRWRVIQRCHMYGNDLQITLFQQVTTSVSMCLHMIVHRKTKGVMPFLPRN